MRKSRGNLFIVSAPSGAGKTTLCQKLSSIIPNLRHSVSYTTRAKRQGEVNNRDYTFIKESVFCKMVERGEFIEWAKVHGNLYGTSRKRLEEMRDKGINVILDIDVQGARQIKRKCPDGVYIFILPPSMRVLRERLEKRMCNSSEEMKERLKRAKKEIEEYKKYDYVIINDNFENALEELRSIVSMERLRARNIDPLWIEKRFLKGGS
jgi:guanylate kinase